MNDSQIYIALRKIINPMFVAKFPGAALMQKVQPRAQGTPSMPTVFMHRVNDHRPGSARRDYDFVPKPGQIDKPGFMSERTVQWIESRIQFSGLMPVADDDGSPTTATDMVRYIALLLSTDGILRALRNEGLNPLRITDVMVPHFTDDHDRFATHPTFDLVVQHTDEITMDVGRIAEVAPEIHAV